MERQNVKLFLKIVNELSLAALKIRGDSRLQEYLENASNFVCILLSLCKLFNINTPSKTGVLNLLEVMDPFEDLDKAMNPYKSAT